MSKKTVEVTEQDIRTALGMSGQSRLADSLIQRLFNPNDGNLTGRVAYLEEQIAYMKKSIAKLKKK